MVYACSVCNTFKADLLPEEFTFRIKSTINKGHGFKGLNTDLLNTVLKNNIKLINDISPYRSDLIRKNRAAKPLPKPSIVAIKDVTGPPILAKYSNENWLNEPEPNFHY